jgi:NDP-4-keto-2,6-dideoxyhexose 3-C-methyltransferase
MSELSLVPKPVITATRRTTCRSCGGQLDDLLSLGELYLSTFLAAGDVIPPKVPLDLTLCRGCDLVQLRHTTQPDLLFRRYWYRSSINEAMRAELRDVVEKALDFYGARPEVVIDIGANDGTLLAAYANAYGEHIVRVAFEPAHNLYTALRPHCQVLFPSYFPEDTTNFGLTAQIITSIACFYASDGPHAYVNAIRQILADDGVWIVQFQDLWQMLEATAYDNITFEHILYYSLRSFEQIISQHGLHVTHGESRAINGGSLRLYVQHAHTTPDETVQQLREQEAGLTYDRLQHFAWATRQHAIQLKALLRYLKESGQIVDLYAASTKSQTLLQFCEIDHTLIRSAVERSPEKIGLKMVGSQIPIVSEADWRNDPGSAVIAGAWQHREFFLARERAYLEAGGSWIFPLPHLEIVRR